MADFILPNLGDGVAQGDVLKVLVKAGDTIKVDQPVVELETDKATIEVPSDVAGKVKEVKAKPGDKLKPGQVVLIMENGASAVAAGASGASGAAPDAPAAPVAPAVERPKVVDIAAGRPAAAVAAVPAPSAASVVTAAPAAPSVRRLAREIGVDVSQVTGTGPGGRITQDDVKEFAKRVMNSFGSGGQAAAASRPAGSGPALPDFSKWGEVERKAMSGIRRKTAEHLSYAWNTIPHVTQFDQADITNLEAMRKKYRGEAEKAGGNLTVTAVAAKVIATALKAFPQFNASVDAAGEAIVYKKYINVGIAVDTDNGLLVPVIRNADQKNLIQLSVEINLLAEKAKARKLTLDEMSGGSMSISNLGGIGGTSFTPIVNWPEVAILGISRGGYEPVWNGTAFEPRQMLPLSLSYDHRLIDGADAIRFLRWVVEALENPFTLALRG
ncbi:MAG: branched-chain alpha-keto acid dehydrogenase subunit E2 [Acidobacteria bacterium]|nr:branched-chain alpha-keto acid dehydrogenase subunit E2 [Acidobacteriota bacterium]